MSVDNIQFEFSVGGDNKKFIFMDSQKWQYYFEERQWGSSSIF